MYTICEFLTLNAMVFVSPATYFRSDLTVIVDCRMLKIVSFWPSMPWCLCRLQLIFAPILLLLWTVEC